MKIIVVLIVALIVAIMGISSLQAFERDSQVYKSENVCIASYVSAGVARSDIIRTGGSCAVKGG